jgi:hypothetical protein
MRAVDPFISKGSVGPIYSLTHGLIPKSFQLFGPMLKDQFASNAPGSEAVKLAHDWLLGFE